MSFAHYHEGSEMGEQEHTDQQEQEQEQEQEQTLDDLEITSDQEEAVKGGSEGKPTFGDFN